MSQAELARQMAARGWPYYAQTVHRIERSQRKVSIGEAGDLADILQTSVGRLTRPVADESLASDMVACAQRLTDAGHRAEDALTVLLQAQAEGRELLAIAATLPDDDRISEASQILRIAMQANLVGHAVEVAGVRLDYDGDTGEAADILQDVKIVRQAVAAVVTAPEGILLGRLAGGDQAGTWSFINGPVGYPGPLEDAAAHWVRRLTGCQVKVGEIIARRTRPDADDQVTYVVARPVGSTHVQNRDVTWFSEVRWVSPAEADELMPSMFAPVREYLARTLKSPGGSR